MKELGVKIVLKYGGVYLLKAYKALDGWKTYVGMAGAIGTIILMAGGQLDQETGNKALGVFGGWTGMSFMEKMKKWNASEIAGQLGEGLKKMADDASSKPPK